MSHIDIYSDVADFSLAEKEIEIIWETVGGSPWEIQYILERLFEYPLDRIVEKLKKERVAMVADWVDHEDADARKELLRHFVNNPMIDRQHLEGRRLVIGRAVHDNILFYDSVEGAYGLQGKSLEWGTKEYFG